MFIFERSHVPVNRRYHATPGFMDFGNDAHRFTRNFEYIRGVAHIG